jgi:RNA polymerase subunit RPABC4/transcription elongation factor Spt4
MEAEAATTNAAAPVNEDDAMNARAGNLKSDDDDDDADDSLPPPAAAAAPLPARRSCYQCSSTSSLGGQWYRSKRERGKWLCKKCYRKEMLVVHNKRECFECHSKTTSTSWARSKTNPSEYVCFNCYSRELSMLSGKRCGRCGATKTSQKWYVSKRIEDEDGDEDEIGVVEGEDDGEDGSARTKEKKKKEKNKDLCRRCYDNEHRVLMDGIKSCSRCSISTTSGRWCKSKVNEGRDLCRKCYKQELKERKASLAVISDI